MARIGYRGFNRVLLILSLAGCRCRVVEGEVAAVVLVGVAFVVVDDSSRGRGATAVRIDCRILLFSDVDSIMVAMLRK